MSREIIEAVKTIEREDLYSGQAALHARGDLAVERAFLVVEIRQLRPLKENGRDAPISNCLKCGAARIARGLQIGGTGLAPSSGLAAPPGGESRKGSFSAADASVVQPQGTRSLVDWCTQRNMS